MSAKRETPEQRKRRIIDNYAKLYYGHTTSGPVEPDAPIWQGLNWFGHTMVKCPNDLWTYQEIYFETAPEVIVECGTFRGGSAMYLASLCTLGQHGEIISVDIAPEAQPEHQRITYFTGSSTDPAIVSHVRKQVDGRRCMVILDSDHSKQHVLDELEAYADLVSPGCYLVVEDTNINGHPVWDSFGPGPWEAVHEWLPGHPEFVIDKSRERFLHTMHPNGYLKRKA